MDSNPSSQKPPAAPLNPVNQPVNPAPAPSSPIPAVPASTPTNDIPYETYDDKKTPAKKSINFLSKALLILGPLFLFSSIGFAIYKIKFQPVPQAPPQTTTSLPAEPAEPADTGIEIKTPEDYAKYAPDNPTQVKAYADNSKQEELVSGQSYSYENPYFEWSGAKTNEPNVEITGYKVYFWALNKPTSNAFVKENYFAPKQHDIIMEKGNTYKLTIQTVTNGQASYGFDKDLKIPSKIYFEYKYE